MPSLYIVRQYIQLIVSQQYPILRYLAYRAILILYEKTASIYPVSVVILVNVNELNVPLLAHAVANGLLG